MYSTPRECREHAQHCIKMASISPPPLAREFQKLALTWSRLADELEAQASKEHTAEQVDNVVEFRPAEPEVSGSRPFG
jgi:hypothetical protein